jgi:hypothetical protein
MNTSYEEIAKRNTGVLHISKHLTPDNSLDKDGLRDTIAVATNTLGAMIEANVFSSGPPKHLPQTLCLWIGHDRIAKCMRQQKSFN